VPPDADTPETDARPPEPGWRILVVDDDPSIRRIVGDVLRKRLAATVDDAPDGAAALETVESAREPYDLVITDMQMPGLTGLELLEALLARRPDLPVVILTAHRSDANVLRSLEKGAADFVVKPIELEPFVGQIRHVLDARSAPADAAAMMEIRSEFTGWVELTAPTDFEYVTRFNRFTTLLGDTPISEEDRDDIRMAINELGQNAVEWGNRNDPGKRIHLSYCVFGDRLVFKIEDEGEGFDPARLNDPSVDPLAHIVQRMQEGKRAGGYGVFITRRLMDDITYNDRGNVVLLTKYFSGGTDG
jgi:CheY-like chemotaxis protein